MTLLDAVPTIERCAGSTVKDYRLDALRDLIHHNMLTAGTGHGGIRRLTRNQIKHETRCGAARMSVCLHVSVCLSVCLCGGGGGGRMASRLARARY